MKRLLLFLCFVPVICFGQYRADRTRTNPNVADGNGYCFRGHLATETSSYCAEATALFARMTTPPTDARKTVINNFITGAKTAGIWQKWDAVYVLAASTQQAALLNWISDTNNATAENSPSFVADSGFKSDGSTSWVNSHFNPYQDSVHFSRVSAAASVYCVTDAALSDKFDIGAVEFTSLYSNILLQTRDASSRINGGLFVNGYYGGYISVPSSIGLTSYSRDASTVYFYKGGSGVGTESYAPTYMPNVNVGIGCLSYWNGTQNSHSTRRISFVCFGSLLSSSEQATLYTLVEAYMDAVGCGTP